MLSFCNGVLSISLEPIECSGKSDRMEQKSIFFFGTLGVRNPE